MELAQLLLVSVVSILTLMLVVVGFQALFILKDFRKSVKKLNSILEDAQSVSSSIVKPIAGTGNIFESFRQMKNIVNYVSARPEASVKQKKQKKVQDTQRILQTQVFLAPKVHTRVFKRNGRPLTS